MKNTNAKDKFGMNRAASKKQIPISLVLMATLLALLYSASPGMAAGKPARTAPVDLGSAGSFVILSESGITDVSPSAITGDIGTSPITGAAITATGGDICPEVTGTIYTVDDAGPACRVINPDLLDAAVDDMMLAYLDAALRAPTHTTELGGGEIGGQTIAPGVWKWSTDVTITTDVTLSGGKNDVWIFQIAGNLSIASGGSVPDGIKVVLAGGAKASNVFWQVGGGAGATLGTYSTFNGNILSATAVVMQTGAVLNGRALAQTLVTLDQNAVSVPNPKTNKKKKS